MVKGSDHILLVLSQQLLGSIKMDTDPADSMRSLQAIPISRLLSGLTDDRSKKLFWINLYNAYFQIFCIREQRTKAEIFTHKGILFSDIKLSLDDVEHGILRRYRWKYSMGYLPQISTNSVVKKLAVETADPRIHFALNCGARSCPPILFYTLDILDQQLDRATASFLAADTEIDHKRKTVFVSRIFLWFLADFGGFSGIRKLLSTYLRQDLSGYRLRFKEFNWDPSLRNFG